MEKPSAQENIYKHLNPGVQPIITCLDTAENQNTPELSGDVEQVDLYCNPEEARKEGYIKEGEMAYIFSPLDNLSKFSLKYANCTGVVAVGKDLETGENVSFMSHQNPGYIFHGYMDIFIRDLNKRIAEVKERCELGTIDIVIFGGQYMKFKEYDDDHEIQQFMKGEYVKSIKLLSEQIEKNFGFTPSVVAGPKLNKGRDFVAFNNEKRRLYLTREDSDDEFTKSFDAKDVDIEQIAWKPGEVEVREYLKGSKSD